MPLLRAMGHVALCVGVFGAATLTTTLAAGRAATAAQEVPFDGDIAVACVGDAAHAAMGNSDHGMTTIGLRHGPCRGWRWRDRDLNRVFGQLIRAGAMIDTDNRASGTRALQLVPVMRNTERAWTVFRDAACRDARAQWHGGTGGDGLHDGNDRRAGASLVTSCPSIWRLMT